MESTAIIRQPYRFTMAIHNMTVLQKRILTQIIKVLQKEMDLVERGTPIGQLALFANAALDTVVINIPKGSVAIDSNNYAKVKAAFKAFMGEEVEFVLPATNGKVKTQETILTRVIERVRWDNHSRHVTIYMHQAMAKELLKITGGYTKYLEDVMMKTNNSYTQRMYEFICHWRDLPVKTLTVKEFRQWLKLEDVYPDTWKLIQKVIKPPQKELKEIADVYFEFSTKKVGTAITHFNFIPKKRLTIEEASQEEMRDREYITQVLRLAFHFKKEHYEQLSEIIIPANFKAIKDKLEYINRYIIKANEEAKSGKRNKIGSVPDYVVTVLKQEFAS